MAGGVSLGESETNPFLGGSNAYTSSYSKSDKLKCYRQNVTTTKKSRSGEGYDDTWKRMRDMYRLRYDKMGGNGQDAIAVPISFSNINVIAPSVSVNLPKITVTARKEEAHDNAAIVEVVVNYWWKHYNVQPEFRRSVKDFLVYGLGVLKVGYKYEESERDMTPEERAAAIEQNNGQLDDFANENPDMAGMLPSHGDIVDAVPSTTQEIVHDAPFVERISVFDFYVDPEATCLDDAKFIMQRIVLPVDRVKQDQRYAKRARNKIKADGTIKWQAEDNKRNMPEPENGRVTLWEYYDTETKEFSVFTEGQDIDFLVAPRPYPYPFGLPFVLIENYDVPDQFYPIGELEAIESLQYELNDTRSSMVRARKLDIAKYVARKGAFDQQAKTALASDVPYTMIETNNDRALQDLIAPLPGNSANAQMYQNHSAVIEGDINNVSGVNDYQRGAQGEIKRTATEASIIQDASNARSAEKLSIIEHAIGEVARRLVGLAQHYMEGEQVARVVGASGATMWVPYSAADIEGEFDFDVEGGSTQPQNETFKRQQSMQLLQVLQPFVPMGVINVQGLLTQVLRDGFGIKSPEKLLQEPPPPPMVDPATGQPLPQDPNALPPDQGQPLPPDQGAVPPAPAGDPNAPPDGGVPPEVLAQLEGQIGLSFP